MPPGAKEGDELIFTTHGANYMASVPPASKHGPPTKLKIIVPVDVTDLCLSRRGQIIST